MQNAVIPRIEGETRRSRGIAAVGVNRATLDPTAGAEAPLVAPGNGAHNCDVFGNGESAVSSGNIPPQPSGGAMGYSKSREKGANHECRTSRWIVYLAPQELQLVVQRARAAGRPVSPYFRESALGLSQRRRRAQLSNAVINMLGQIALRLTHLATEAKNQRLAQAHEFDEAVSKALDIIRELE